MSLRRPVLSGALALAAIAGPQALAQPAGEVWRPEQIAGEVPVYPGQALRRSQEGDCAIVFRIDQDGRADELEIRCTDPLFEPAATAAAQSWRFTPWPGPEALSVRRYSKPIRFRLDDRPSGAPDA